MVVYSLVRNRQFVLYVIDAIIITGCLQLGYLIRFYGLPILSLKPYAIDRHTGASLVLIAVVLFCLYIAELYPPNMRFSRSVLATRLLFVTASTSFITAAFYYALPGYVLSRGHFLGTMIPLPFALFAWRALYLSWLWQRMPSRRTLVLGAGRAGQALARDLLKHNHHPYRITGFADSNANSGGPVLHAEIPVIGKDAELERLVATHNISTVMVAITNDIDDDVIASLIRLKARGIDIQDLGDVYRNVLGKVPLRHHNQRYFLYSPGFGSSLSRFARFTQRCFDLVFASLLLLLLTPVAVVIAVVIKLESCGPAFFIQERVGLNGKLFRMLKLRTMVDDAPRDGQWMDTKLEAHLTRIGGFLRRTRLNEIPQLLNILTGNMSLIGPRPETQAHVETLTQAIPLYNLRHMVKPGLSGWAAVNAGYAGSIEAHEEVLQYDLFYAERKSIHLNLLILVKTISTVLFRPGK